MTMSLGPLCWNSCSFPLLWLEGECYERRIETNEITLEENSYKKVWEELKC